MKKIIGIGLLDFQLLSPDIAQATPITVTATGQINYSRDDFNLFGLGVGDDTIKGAAVTATWTFDTDNAGSNVSADPERVSYQPLVDWIDSSVDIDTSTVDSSFIPVDVVADEDGFYDLLQLEDENGVGSDFDRYFVSDDARDASPYERAFSYAQIYSYIDNLISSFDSAQTLSWAADDFADDLGNGYFEYSNGSTQVTLGQYTLHTFVVTSGSVPEPSTLILMGLGLAGLGLRGKSVQRLAALP